MRYGVEIQPAGAADDRPTILCPDDVRQLVAPEMAGLAQEQVRILLLDSRNHVVGQRVIYQGNVNSAMVRPARGAEVLRPVTLPRRALLARVSSWSHKKLQTDASKVELPAHGRARVESSDSRWSRPFPTSSSATTIPAAIRRPVRTTPR